MNERWPTRGLYAITPDDGDTDRLVARVDRVLNAGAIWLQYRNKAAHPGLRARQARALQPVCRRHGVPLIINDDWRLAAVIEADGVHLGEDDAALAVARDALGPDAIVGASCYDDVLRASRAIAAGASYVAFGAFFPSLTKPAARHARPSLLAALALPDVPRVAIGGITPDNARALIDAGADLVAAVGGIFDAPDPEAATRAYLSCFQEAPHE